MGILKHIATVACMLIASTAQADWDHTEWGQSLQSLLNMDEYEVVENPGEEWLGTIIAETHGQSLWAFGKGVATAKTTENLKYWSLYETINFMMTGENKEDLKLSAIVIRVSIYNDRLLKLLQDRYGTAAIMPAERSIPGNRCDTRVLFWSDEPSGNNIRLIEADCANWENNLRLLIYSPILTAENSPL